MSAYIFWRNGGPAREKQPRRSEVSALHADFKHLNLPAGHQLCSSNAAFSFFGLVPALGLTGSSSAAAGAETRVAGTPCAHTSGMHLSWCWPWEGACVPASFATFLHPRCIVYFVYLAVFCPFCLKLFQDSWLLLGDDAVAKCFISRCPTETSIFLGSAC